MNKFKLAGIYFCGNKASDYAIAHNRLDYLTLSKAFDCVLANGILGKTSSVGCWDIENGDFIYFEDADGNTYNENEKEERIEELEERIEELKELEELTPEQIKELEELEEDLDSLEYEHYNDVFQYFIISSAGAQILADYTNEIVFYNSELDMYVWGVTHWGTGWDYVLTDIPLNCGDDAFL